MKSSSSSRDNLRLLSPTITDQQIAQLEKFADSLREWNRRHNLISRNDVHRIWEHHILPSLVPLTLVEFPNECWLLDIGSGGGFPSIPIKIVRPDLQMILVDSVRKKALFLQKMILELQLKNIAVKKERIESLIDPFLKEKFDVVTARAVANVSRLTTWGRPFLKRSGFLLLWKGDSDAKEMQEVAENSKLRYEVKRIPDSLTVLSPKFEDLRFFQIWMD